LAVLPGGFAEAVADELDGLVDRPSPFAISEVEQGLSLLVW